MKPRPILFSGAMVRALLAGTKTQTRRIVKPQPHPVGETGSLFIPAAALVRNDWAWPSGNPGCTTISCKPNGPTGWAENHSPYGVTGDRLWVKENWQAWDKVGHECDDWEPWDRERRGSRTYAQFYAECGPPDRILFEADGGSMGPWNPSIYMPRWASRITLEITGVRVERLNKISEADCRAEGITAQQAERCDGYDYDHGYKAAYAALWDAINGEGAWCANPWVWVIEFKRVEPA